MFLKEEAALENIVLAVLGAAKKQGEKNGDSTVPITLTSNANYDANQQARKKSGIFKGIGNLLK